MGISTHILDTALGRPATGVAVTLFVEQGSGWLELAASATDADGRCKHLLPATRALEPANYRIRFATGDYYAAQGVEGLYPFVDVAFTVTDHSQHFHIPLLLTANGYTTYRGS